LIDLDPVLHLAVDGLPQERPARDRGGRVGRWLHLQAGCDEGGAADQQGRPLGDRHVRLRHLVQAFLYPLVFTASTAAKPITLGVVTDLIRGDGFSWGDLMLGALIAGLPVAVLVNYVLDDFVEAAPVGACE
jgi:hypothetical protein